MSTIRSLITGMLPIGSTDDRAVAGTLGGIAERVLQASADAPLIWTPHEPQIAARHEQRIPIEASSRSFTCRIASSTERSGGSSTS